MSNRLEARMQCELERELGPRSTPIGSTGSMTLGDFADAHRLRLGLDSAGDPVIPGRVGELYQYAPGRFGCLVLGASPRLWGSRRRALVAAGCAVIQDGDTEGCALFDPADPLQADVAIRAVGARRRRPPATAAQRAALEAGRIPFGSVVQGAPSAPESPSAAAEGCRSGGA